MKFSLDIETLDTAASAVVLSIGVCAVTQDGVKPLRLKTNLDIQSQLDAGRTISSSTLQWWLTQDAETRDGAFDAQQEVREALFSVRGYLGVGESSVFVKGPAFDAAILDAAILDDLAATFNVPPVCDCRRWRDLRTLDDVIEMSGDEKLQYEWATAKVETAPERAHDALEDAVGQGELLAHFWRECAQ